jgi:nucleoside-diphosphate-sugar epimerase
MIGKGKYETIRAEAVACVEHDRLPFNILKGKTVVITGCHENEKEYFLLFLNEISNHLNLGIRIIALTIEKTIFPNNIVQIVRSPGAPINIDEQVDIIIQMSNNSTMQDRKEHPIKVLKDGTIETLSLIEFARRKRIERYILLSTTLIYGAGPVGGDNKPLSESDYRYLDMHKLGSSSYPLSKIYAECLLLAEHIETGLDVCFVRKTASYGVCFNQGHGGAIEDFINNVFLGEDIIIKGDGKSERSFIYDADFARSMLYVLFYGKACEAYNSADPNSYVSIFELANIVNDVSGSKVKIIVKNENTNYQDMKINPSIEKIRGLGFEPKYSLQEGIKETISHMN